MVDAASSRVMTPVERKEARMQQVLTGHQERMRRLAQDRQQILQSQALYLGRVEPQVPDTGTDTAARTSQRQSLVHQLIHEQAAAEALVEALKQGQTLDEARRVSQAVHAEMTAIRRHAEDPGDRHRGAVVAAHVPAAGSLHISPTPDSTQAAPAPAAGMLGAMLTRTGNTKPHPGLPAALTSAESTVRYQSQAQRPPGSSSSIAPQSQLLWRHETSSGADQRARLEAALREEQWLAEQEQSGGRAQGGGGGHQRGRSAAASRGAVVGPRETVEAPGYVEELRTQVEGLKQLLESQLQRQSAAPPPGPVPMILPMPTWYPQGPPPGPNQAAQPPQLAEGVSEEMLHTDPAMRAVHSQHLRDMALLKMELDRARTATELEHIRTALAEVRQKSQSLGLPSASLPLPPPSVSTPRTAPAHSILMMDVPAPEPTSTQHPEDSDLESDFTDDDDTLAERPFSLGAGTVVRADVLNVHVVSVGPCVVRGSYRVRVVLYDGFQPLFVGPDLVVGSSTSRRAITSLNAQQVVQFNETLSLRGLSLTETMMLVFEVYVAKQPLAGMPSREDLCAWSYCGALHQGEVLSGRQSVPLYRMPIMMSAQRHFSYHGAMINFSVSHSEGEPGEGVPQSATESGSHAGTKRPGQGQGPGAATGGPEDIAGVPSAAFLRVARGIPPAEPFTPGEGLVVVVDAGRFLPVSVTISKVVCTVFSPDRRPLTAPCEALSQPDSDCYSPRYGQQFTLAQGEQRFDNAAATLLFTVYTVERWTNRVRVVGYGALPCFLDPRGKDQPLSKNVQDYVLNTGAFQVPLFTALPSDTARPFRASVFEQGVCRVPCASLLIRVLSPEAAKAQRRQPPPAYPDRVYDSVRALPSAVERPLFSKYMGRKPLLVREAARLLVSARGPAGAAQADAGALPASDEELLDWIEGQLTVRPQDSAALSTLINFNLASEYYPDLGFYVAVDGAMRIPRNLPSGALITFAPPGSFYQDNPVVDDMKVTLEYDMAACLAAPRWVDGYQHFVDVVYEPGLALLIDIRLLVPSAGSTSPVGWAVLPVFERTGAFVSSGSYHLPLFQGVPSRNILQEFAAKGDVDSVVIEQLRSKRIKVHEECCSVLVRLLDSSRQGQLQTPLRPDMGPQALSQLRLPAYVNELGPKFLSTMRKDIKNKTYAQTKPANLSEDVWKEQLNNCMCKIVGLEVKYKDKVDDAESDEDVI